MKWLLAFVAGGLSLGAGSMPSEEQVRAVRAAWIAERLGDLATARRLFTEAGATWPDEPYLLDETLRFLDRTGGDPALTAGLRGRLEAALVDPARPLPLPIVRRRVIDPAARPAEIDALRANIVTRLVTLPSDPDLLEVLAGAQRRLQDEAGLGDTLRRLSAVRPSHALDWERLFLAQRARRWPEAKEILDRMESAGDHSANVRFMRLPVIAHLQGVEAVLAAVGDPPEGERRVAAGALQEIGWELWDEGRDADAERMFRRALALSPKDVHAAEVVTHLFASEEERAARSSSTAAAWDAVDNADRLLQEGTSRLVAGDAAGAYPFLQRAATALPNEPVAWYNLGLAAKKTERFAEAVTALTRALDLREDWPPALRALAEALAKTGDCAGAVVAAKRAGDLDAASADPFVTLYNCYQSMGDGRAAAAAKAEYERRKAAGAR